MGKEADTIFEYWAANMIFIPAWLYKYGFDDKTFDHLEKLIDQQVQGGYITPGKDQIGQKPGSDVVYVAEIQEESAAMYKKHFFCMAVDLGAYQICSLAKTD